MEEQKINTLWTHLHWLSVLAQQGSYTAAAARLGVSKAAMSQRIAELERAAKVTLVQRTTRSVRLTEAGQKLVDDTRAAFEQIDAVFSQTVFEQIEAVGRTDHQPGGGLQRQVHIVALLDIAIESRAVRRDGFGHLIQSRPLVRRQQPGVAAVADGVEDVAREAAVFGPGNERDVARGGFLPQVDLSASIGRESRSTPLADCPTKVCGPWTAASTS